MSLEKRVDNLISNTGAKLGSIDHCVYFVGFSIAGCDGEWKDEEDEKITQMIANITSVKHGEKAGEETFKEEAKIAEKKAEIAKERADIEKGTFGAVGFSDKDNREKLAKLNEELAELEAEFGVSTGDKKTYNINETYVDNIVKEASVRKAKQVLLKSLTAAKDDSAPANITTIMDNKRITGDVISTNHHMMAQANTDHSDAAVKSINDIRFGRG